MRKCVFDVASATLLMFFFGMIVVAIMNNKGVDPVIMWSAAGIVVSITCIIDACFIYNEKNGFLGKYFRRYVSKEDGDFYCQYNASLKVKIAFLLLLLVVLLVAFVIDLSVGISYFKITSIVRVLYEHLMGVEFEFGTEDWRIDLFVWNSRLPKALVAIVAGASLAVGGAVMQSVVKNPLADPYTTGISSGAVFGVCLGLVMGLTVGGTGQIGLTLNAFLFSLIPAGVMIFVSRISNSSPITIILVGTAISSIFGSFSTLIMSIADDSALKATFEWEVGSLSGAGWDYLPLMTTIALVASVFLYFTSSKLNVLMMGDNEAKALGLNVDNYRMLCLLILSFMTASVVSYIGIIGFLGLVTAHIVRMFLGSDTKFVLPASALLGAVILLVADIISINIGINDLPVGVVMSFIGGPMFLLLVLRNRREVWD